MENEFEFWIFALALIFLVVFVMVSNLDDKIFKETDYKIIEYVEEGRVLYKVKKKHQIFKVYYLIELNDKTEFESAEIAEKELESYLKESDKLVKKINGKEVLERLNNE